MANAEVFDLFFRRADLDKDGRISGQEAVGFFQGAGLPQMTLAKVRALYPVPPVSRDVRICVGSAVSLSISLGSVGD